VIPDNSPNTLTAVDKIQFIFRMKMDREVKIIFDALKDQKTVFRAQLGDFSVYLTSHEKIESENDKIVSGL
jgi:precorrin-4 methylase